MMAYKAFDAGLVCRGYQFSLGRNVTDKANCAQNGFHCAENPLDCLSYYSNLKQSEYYLVDALGDIDEDDRDSKIACTVLNIIRRLSPEEFFMHGLMYMANRPKRAWSRHVAKERGEARGGFAVVRGVDPVARGKNGDILALAQEDADTQKITALALVLVNGEQALPGVWYDINLKERTAA